MKKAFVFVVFYLLTLLINAQVTLNLKLFLEGYYIGSNTGLMDNNGSGGCLFINNISADPSDVDTIRVSLVDPVSASVKGSVKGILKTDGSLSVNFDSSIVPGHAYYIRIQHRSAIETWSTTVIAMSSVTNYDFSTSASQAYGNNMTNVGTVSQPVWAFYSGDIADAGAAQACIQDWVMESQDLNEMENAFFVTLTGYVCQDITGDGIVDSLDNSIEERNVFFVIFSLQPYLAGINEIENRKNNNLIIKCFSDGVHLRFVDQTEVIHASKLSVYSMDGRIVFETQFSSRDNFYNLISELRLSSGMYVLNVTIK